MAHLARLHLAYSQRREELEARYPLLDPEGWIERVDQLRREPWQWAVACKFRCQPMGDEASCLILLSQPSLGALWWNRRSGLSFVRLEDEPKVELASGHAPLPVKAARSLWRASLVTERGRLEDVPYRCYDGVEATVVFRGVDGGSASKATCNAADVGQEPALVLARAAFAVVSREPGVGRLGFGAFTPSRQT